MYWGEVVDRRRLLEVGALDRRAVEEELAVIALDEAEALVCNKLLDRSLRHGRVPFYLTNAPRFAGLGQFRVPPLTHLRLRITEDEGVF